jgi:hypothetical protein
VSKKVRPGPARMATGTFEQQHVVASVVSKAHYVDLTGRHHGGRLYKRPATVNRDSAPSTARIPGVK